MNVYNQYCAIILFVDLEEALRGSKNWPKLAFVRTGYHWFHIRSVNSLRMTWQHESDMIKAHFN